ncbi:MAG: HAMP domain-containing protein [Anaerolineales bacterium]|nr:HAMP domain-containing protein [Chloroflexota bacterium]MBL6981680.1 HAMP domain-containing protein [Anaerolineales bacterium]
MMFSSLRSRLLLTYAIVIGVALCVVGIVTLVYLARNPSQTIQARLRLQNAADTIDQRTENLGNAGLPAVMKAAERFDESFDVRVLVYSRAGELIVDSRQETEPALQLQPTQRESQRLNFVTSVHDIEGNEWLYLARPLSIDQWLILATPRPRMTFLAALRTRTDDIIRPLQGAGLVALLISLVLAILMARWVAGPLQRIAQSAKGIASGEYHPIKLEGPDEVKSLARAFNEMSEQVQVTQQSQRDFIANVSHELKTPLTSIQGFAQAIMDGTAQSDNDLSNAADVIHSEAERMHRLVLHLLDLARLDSGTFQFERVLVNLPTLLKSVVTKLTPQAMEAKVVLKLHIDPLPSLIGDGDRLAQVFTNLVENAIKHTPEDGEVRVVAVPSEGLVEISVIDSGEGIHKTEVSRIFERFYQVDRSRPGGVRRARGAGLGLAISNEIILAHGGQLSVTSSPGQGSVFVVKLPLARSDDSTLAERRRA